MLDRTARILLILATSIGLVTVLGMGLLRLFWGEWTGASLAAFSAGIAAIVSSLALAFQMQQMAIAQEYYQENRKITEIQLFEARERLLSHIDELALEVKTIKPLTKSDVYAPNSNQNLHPRFLLETIHQDLMRVLLLGDTETARQASDKVRNLMQETPWVGSWASLFEHNAHQDESL